MTYAVIAVERALKIQDVIHRAMSGALTWLQAGDILRMHPRSAPLARGSSGWGMTGCSIVGASIPRPV